MEGRKKISIEAASDLLRLSKPLIEQNGFLQRWLTIYPLSLARFSDWEKIKHLKKPDQRFQYAVGIWHYTQGLAELALNEDMSKIENHLKVIESFISQGPVDQILGTMGLGLLKISKLILEGIVAEKKNNHSLSIDNFSRAIELQDTISGEDPPSWYFPVRQLLGHIYLMHENYNKAKSIFLEDLNRHPHNGWSLYGLSEAEKQLKNSAKAEQYKKEFQNAWKHADIDAPIFPIWMTTRSASKLPKNG